MTNIFSVKVVSYNESRELDREYDHAGKCIDMKPKEGSVRAFLDLALPSGKVIRTEIAHTDFEEHVVPIIRELNPDSI